MKQRVPSVSTIRRGARSLRRATRVGANRPDSRRLSTAFRRGSRRHNVRCGVTDFQQAIAYAADGEHSSMLRLTAPGDGSAGVQETDMPRCRRALKPDAVCPAAVTGRMTMRAVLRYDA